jgi:hypothetical protein
VFSAGSEPGILKLFKWTFMDFKSYFHVFGDRHIIAKGYRLDNVILGQKYY